MCGHWPTFGAQTMDRLEVGGESCVKNRNKHKIK